MEFESTNSNTTSKLPILKLGEYKMWVIRIKHYFQIQDYALWEVIENGDSWVSIPQTAQENGTSVTKMSIPVTAEEKTNKKNDVKARSLLLMALPNEHQLTFSQNPDAKTMFAAIETRFGGNAATKKTQKTLLKQQYENFSASSAKSLNSIFNRLQKIVSRLAILGVVIAQEDLNSNFLSSLPPEWNTHVVVSMNKPKVETISIDDLTASFSDNAVYAFMVENPNGSNLLHQDLEQIHEDDLKAMDLKWQLSLLSMRTKRYYQRTGKKIFINANDTAGYDKLKVECFNCHKMGYFARECRAPKSKEGQFRNQDNIRKQGNNKDTSSKAMLAIYGVGFDWSDMAEEQVQINMALMAFLDSELNQTEFTATTYKRGLATVEEQLITYRKNEVLFSKEVAVLKREVACKDYEINMLKSEFEKIKQEKDGIEFKIEKFDKASKDLDKLLGNDSKEIFDESLVEEQVSQDTGSFVESLLNVDKETVFPVDERHVKRGRDTKIPYSSGPHVKVGDEAVYKELGDRMERAATTTSSLEAEQDSGSGPRCQDTILRDVDAQPRLETTSKQSNNPPLSKVYTFGSGVDSMKILELMELYTKLSNMLHKNRKSDLVSEKK
ncbi:ribonuclease H-like domain-containing protein [Tanacetum coccineum]